MHAVIEGSTVPKTAFASHVAYATRTRAISHAWLQEQLRKIGDFLSPHVNDVADMIVDVLVPLKGLSIPEAISHATGRLLSTRLRRAVWAAITATTVLFVAIAHVGR